MTASRTHVQAPQVLQVAFEYVAGQIAIRLPAGVYRASEAVRLRHSPIVSAHSSRRLLNSAARVGSGKDGHDGGDPQLDQPVRMRGVVADPFATAKPDNLQPSTFNLQRHLVSRSTLRIFRAEAASEWWNAVAAV